MEVRKLSHSLGAEVLGFKFRADPSPQQVAEIRRLFLEHGILLFRGQDISFDEHIAFSLCFGHLDRHDAVPDYRHPEYPELIRVGNEGRERSQVFGQQWHSDHSMALRPSMASLLHAHEVPDVGGDTMFANMYEAYETLSAGMRALLDPLEAVHSIVASRHLRGADPKLLEERLKTSPPVLHPVVRTHAETGRKALYVNEMMTSHFEGMTTEESQPLLQFLFQHSTRPEFVYRHRWRKHDLIMWDNRCSMHLALLDYDYTQVRRLYRTTVEDDYCGRYAAMG